MAKYTIKELYEEWYDNEMFESTFLFADAFDAPVGTDTRPAWVKPYVDNNSTTAGNLDKYIVNKYGAYIFDFDADDVETATYTFIQYNCVYGLTHNTELNMIHKAFTTDFNPLENYDRIEDTSVESNSTSGATSKTAPDDSETFYNVGSADSSASGTNITSSRIHGNIGVTQSTDMLKNAVQYFTNNAYIDVMIDRVIRDNCFMVDYGYNII